MMIRLRSGLLVITGRKREKKAAGAETKMEEAQRTMQTEVQSQVTAMDVAAAQLGGCGCGDDCGCEEEVHQEFVVQDGTLRSGGCGCGDDCGCESH